MVSKVVVALLAGDLQPDERAAGAPVLHGQLHRVCLRVCSSSPPLCHVIERNRQE
jgi:hypothetical protein